MRTLLIQGEDNVPVPGVPAGTLAIYNSGAAGTDDSPASSPLTNLSKIAMHSALDYVGIIGQLDTTITISAINASSPSTRTFHLYSHTFGAKPMSISMLSAAGSDYGALNGTVWSEIGSPLMGRSMIIQADETDFYLRVTEWGNLPADTLSFRTLILDRAYGGEKTPTNEVFYADTGTVRAAGGMFDSSKKYIQTPGPTQGAIFHMSGQTMGLGAGDETGEIDITIHNVWNYNGVVNAVNAVGSPLFYDPAAVGTYCVLNGLATGGNANLGTALELSSTRMAISDSSGVDLFNTSRKTMTFVGEYKGALTTSSHGATNYTTEVPHEQILATIPMPSQVDMLMGWMQITSAPSGVTILTNKPLDLSGSVLVYSTLAVDGSGNVWLRTYATISARMRNGNLEIVESWFNSSVGGSSAAIPSFSFDVQVYACALTGGF